MENNHRDKKRSRRNAKISQSKRQKLIYFVMEKSYSIGKAAHRVKIKLSTAKMIVKRYSIDGTFYQSKSVQKKKHTNQSQKKDSSIEDNNFKQEQEICVKVQEEKPQEGDIRVKMEEINYPVELSPLEEVSQPILPPWNMPYVQYSQLYEGYVVQNYTDLLQNLYFP